MNQSKLVSVTINAYNSEKYIAQTLESVINQTYQNLQIIVVDDASTDNTVNIVKGFNDPRIELYVLEKNGHISNANNQTYLNVRGEYMVHTDADDVLNPDLIEKTVGFLEQNPKYGAAFCRLSVIDQDGNVAVNEYIENVFKVTAKTQAEFVRLFFDSLNHISHTGATIRKSVLDKVGFHDLSLCYLHDFDYWTRVILECPIYVFDECLAKYRMNITGAHNSYLDQEKMNAHNTEFLRIIYRMIDNCPDNLFLEAFADRLRLKGEHTPEEVKLEKAFLLQDGLIAINSSENKILSTLMFSRLFSDKKYVDIAQEKFGFTIKDFYNQQTTPSLYDYGQIKSYKTEILNLQNKADYFYSHIEELREDIKKKGDDLSYYIDLVNHKQSEIDAKDLLIQQKQNEIDIQNSIILHKQKLLNKTVEYRILKFFSKVFLKIKNILRRIKHILIIRDKNGKKYHKLVMLYGYYAINFGDDLFFEKLITRYPNTMFLVYSVYLSKEYRTFFEQFNNVKFYSTDDAFVQKINKIGNHFKIENLFEFLLLKRSNATVHIGGSIYQEVGDYKLDYKIRKRRKQPCKPFYSISCNFGAYKSENFKKMWVKQFKKFKDICFRDKYSYNLFKNMKNVRYAPDLLFSYKANQIPQKPQSVAISVLDPLVPGRNISTKSGEAYFNAITKTVCDLISSGNEVSLLSFCAFEGDSAFIEKICNNLPSDFKIKVNVVNYSLDNKDDIINALSSAEYIIATRLHSAILGFVLGKKVLPITYNKKIENILDDIGYNQPFVNMENISEYENVGFAKLLNQINKFDAKESIALSEHQLAKLDTFLK